MGRHGRARNRKSGIDPNTWTDHTNVRPTILSLLGLKDDYTDDGHVLVQALDKPALPTGAEPVRRSAASSRRTTSSTHPSVISPQATLAASTRALKSTDRTEYNDIENAIASLTSQRDTLAGAIRSALNAAAFAGTPISTRRRRAGSTRRTR